jgi:hypothetical protein
MGVQTSLAMFRLPRPMLPPTDGVITPAAGLAPILRLPRGTVEDIRDGHRCPLATPRCLYAVPDQSNGNQLQRRAWRCPMIMGGTRAAKASAAAWRPAVPLVWSTIGPPTVPPGPVR